MTRCQEYVSSQTLDTRAKPTLEFSGGSDTAIVKVDDTQPIVPFRTVYGSVLSESVTTGLSRGKWEARAYGGLRPQKTRL